MRLKPIALALSATGALALAGCATPHSPAVVLTPSTVTATAPTPAATPVAVPATPPADPPAAVSSQARAGTYVLNSDLRVFRGRNDPWAKVAAPSPGPAHSYGTYAAGCIAGAVPLPLNGTGYQVMRPLRHRYYGHPDLIRFITGLGREVRDQGDGTLLIGDMGLARGGPMPSGHASHQVGLDVDIWLSQLPAANRRPLTLAERQDTSAISFVAPDDRHVNRHWSKRQADIIRLTAQSPAVDRLFVNPAIKLELCREYPGADWLHKVRPWWLHIDHEHVRLKHDPADPWFITQDPIPTGTGCDPAVFNWWFTQEDLARTEAKHPPAHPPAPHPVILPAACEAVIQQK